MKFEKKNPPRVWSWRGFLVNAIFKKPVLNQPPSPSSKLRLMGVNNILGMFFTGGMSNKNFDAVVVRIKGNIPFGGGGGVIQLPNS